MRSECQPSAHLTEVQRALAHACSGALYTGLAELLAKIDGLSNDSADRLTHAAALCLPSLSGLRGVVLFDMALLAVQDPRLGKGDALNRNLTNIQS